MWHDNSGEGSNASWYLKFIIVHDLQTKERFYFLCERWFAVEKGDGKIDRLLTVATDSQKANLQYLAQKQIKNNIADNHLWLSIFTRPAASSFTRLDRVTCVFVLLFMSMLMNILYYGVAAASKAQGLVIGPFSISPEQVNLFIFKLNQPGRVFKISII